MRIRLPGYFPFLVLLAAVLLLTALLAVLGQRGLRRETTILLDVKRQQARFMASALSTASRFDLLLPDPGRRSLRSFVYDAAATEGVAFVGLYDGEYRLIASSRGFDPGLQGLSPSEVRALLGGGGTADFMATYPGSGTVLVTVSRFAPLDAPWFRLRLLEVPPIPGVTRGEEAEGDVTRVAVIGLSTADLDKAVAESRRQLLLYGFVLLMLGSIGFYFLILVQTSYSTEKALENVRQYAIDVVEGMAEGLVNIDHDGVVRTLNPEAERILGIRAAGAVGRHWRDVFAGERWADFAAFISAGRPFYGREVPPRGPDLAPLVVTLTAVRGQAGRGGLVFFLRDLEEVESLRDEVRRSERLAALGRLVAGMAHEIRNPLNSIRGFTQLLAGKFPAGSGEARAVEIIVREVDRLNRVITDLLDFSRPKQARMTSLDLDDAVRAAVLLVEREAAAAGVKVVTEPAGGVRVRGDSDSIKQLMLNLLLNALQAMPDGGVVTITTRNEDGGAVLTVADTGVGISPDDAVNIFEPFFTTRKQGTGLGLAIVHRIVQDHGAEIRVRSTPGKGASFTVRFPAPGPGAGGKGERA